MINANNQRLPPQAGEWIDRSRQISFRFEGKDYQGLDGDTISTALLAAGVRMIGRSFKYHRPRGIFSMTGADANVMLEGSSGTNLRGDETLVTEGLDVRAVNTLGGVRRDLLAALGRLSAFTPVGFYYKSMHTPRMLFPLYERVLRKLAGLGRVCVEHREPPSPKRYGFCDVLVVGAGSAGVAAANAAAACGAKVLLVESSQRLDSAVTEAVNGRVQCQFGSTCVGIYPDLWAAVVDSKCLTKIRTKSLVLATGCEDQPAIFGNNDLPGVMLGEAARRLMERYSVRPSERPLVLTAGRDGYYMAESLLEREIRVAGLVDLRERASSSHSGGDLIDYPVIHAHAVVEAVPRRGNSGVKAARLRAIDDKGHLLGPVTEIPCDGIIVCVSRTPRDGLLRQAGGTMAYEQRLHRHVPEVLPDGFFAVGSLAGIDGSAVIKDGQMGGLAAANYLGLLASGSFVGPRDLGVIESGHPYPIFSESHPKAFVDLDEDVIVKDLAHAIQEGYDDIELLKRYTTVGMGPSQGLHANLSALRVFARLTKRPIQSSRLTTARPFTKPVPMRHLAGHGFSPIRRTSVHYQHERLGAPMLYAGNWLRPAFYPRPGLDKKGCIDAEAQEVRLQGGLIDVGTLGKLEICGVDAVVFLEQIYTGRFAAMKIGMTRYAVMCDESGVVIDDGVIGRLASDRFYVSTTSSGADQVYREMQRWVAVWRMDVALVNATSTWAAFNIAGPHARRVLGGVTNVDLSPETFPYLGIREGMVAGAPARLSRVGFVGELGFEVHVPVGWAVGVWEELLSAGAPYGIVPFGVEAQRLLRLEKGHLIVSQDTDGLTDPFEANLGWAVKLNKPFFVGQRSLQIIVKKRSRRKLVGFELSLDSPTPMENQLIISDDREITGRVTSVGRSTAVGRTIGLAYVLPEESTAGTSLRIKGKNGELLSAQVASTPFFDPEGIRLRS